MAADAVLDGFAAEARSLAAAMAAEPAAAFGAPSPCPPWTVIELFAHVANAAGRVCGMLAGPEPEAGPGGQGLVSAVGYYRADRRFSATTTSGVLTFNRVTSRQPASLSLAHQP